MPITVDSTDAKKLRSDIAASQAAADERRAGYDQTLQGVRNQGTLATQGLANEGNLATQEMHNKGTLAVAGEHTNAAVTTTDMANKNAQYLQESDQFYKQPLMDEAIREASTKNDILDETGMNKAKADVTTATAAGRLAGTNADLMAKFGPQKYQTEINNGNAISAKLIDDIAQAKADRARMNTPPVVATPAPTNTTGAANDPAYANYPMAYTRPVISKKGYTNPLT